MTHYGSPREKVKLGKGVLGQNGVRGLHLSLRHYVRGRTEEIDLGLSGLALYCFIIAVVSEAAGLAGLVPFVRLSPSSLYQT